MRCDLQIKEVVGKQRQTGWWARRRGSGTRQTGQSPPSARITRPCTPPFRPLLTSRAAGAVPPARRGPQALGSVPPPRHPGAEHIFRRLTHPARGRGVAGGPARRVAPPPPLARCGRRERYTTADGTLGGHWQHTFGCGKPRSPPAGRIRARPPSTRQPRRGGGASAHWRAGGGLALGASSPTGAVPLVDGAGGMGGGACGEGRRGEARRGEGKTGAIRCTHLPGGGRPAPAAGTPAAARHPTRARALGPRFAPPLSTGRCILL